VCIKLIICCYTVTAQEGPGTVIVHPGQDVELLCTFNDLVLSSHTLVLRWEINHRLYGINALINGLVPGYSSNGRNLIVENIMMNDGRNGTEYRCVLLQDQTVINEDNPSILYIAGEYIRCIHLTVTRLIMSLYNSK